MTQRTWTITELNRASEMWRRGESIRSIAAALGRCRSSVGYHVERKRDLFPRRRRERPEVRAYDLVKLRFTVSPFLHKSIREEASRRGISQSMLINEALRDRFIRRLSPLENA